jgi:hypothetical protein
VKGVVEDEQEKVSWCNRRGIGDLAFECLSAGTQRFWISDWPRSCPEDVLHANLFRRHVRHRAYSRARAGQVRIAERLRLRITNRPRTKVPKMFAGLMSRWTMPAE